MKTNSKKLISTLLTLAMVFSLFIAMPPPKASAATGMATINLATLGNSNTVNDNSAQSATQSQWSYAQATRTLYLNTDGGNYTLTGARPVNVPLTVVAGLSSSKQYITLNNASWQGPGANSVGTFEAPGDFEMTLIGTNEIRCTSPGERASMVLSGVNSVIKGSGSLELSGNYGAGIRMSGSSSSTKKIEIKDTARVTINKNTSLLYDNIGIDITAGTRQLCVGKNARLDVTANYGIVAAGAGSQLGICNSGLINVTAAGANDGNGINAAGRLYILGYGDVGGRLNAKGVRHGINAGQLDVQQGEVHAEGGTSGFAVNTNTPENIFLGSPSNDRATLVMTNNSSATEYHTFQRYSPTHENTLFYISGVEYGGSTNYSGYLGEPTVTVGVRPGGSLTGLVLFRNDLINWSVSANGYSAFSTSWGATTTQLTLAFDVNPDSTLTADDITVSGATKGELSGTGRTRTLDISNITVENGQNVRVDIRNKQGVSFNPSSRNIRVYVSNAPEIKSPDNFTCIKGVGGTFQFTATGVKPIIWSGASFLPSGVSISDGTLQVSDSAPAGVYTFEIRAQNAWISQPFGTVAGYDFQTFTLTVIEHLRITSANNYTCGVGDGGSFQLTASGTPAASGWNIFNQPAGVSIGNITEGKATLNVAPTVPEGVYKFTITAYNKLDNQPYDAWTQQFTLVVGDSSVTITSADNLTISTAESAMFLLTGVGTPDITTWSLENEPAGVSIIQATGSPYVYLRVLGTPMGTYNFNIKAGNGIFTATQAFTLTVTGIIAVPTITSADNYTCPAGAGGIFGLTTGFPASLGLVTWSIEPAGTAPEGVSAANNPFNNNGNLTVSATAPAGVYSFVIRVSSPGGAYTEQLFTLTIEPPQGAPVIESADNMTCQEGTAANLLLAVTSTDPGDITWSLSPFFAYSPPAGVTIATVGRITRLSVPNSIPEGVYNFPIFATNSIYSTRQDFRLTVTPPAPAPPTITSGSNYSCYVGFGGSFDLEAEGAPPIMWSLTGAPSEVFVSGGKLNVSPSVTKGTYNFTVKASNGNEPDAAQAFTLSVTNLPPDITSADNYSCAAGTGGSFSFAATSVDSVVWSIDGQPDGVTLSGSTLTVSSDVPKGLYGIAVTASNGVLPDTTQAFTLTVKGTEAVIDISTLAGTSVSSPAGVDSWEYSTSNRLLSLTKANGDYTLTGTNSNLKVDVSGGNLNITLDNVTLTSSTGGRDIFVVNGDAGVTIIGANSIAGGAVANAIRVNNSSTLSIRGGGSLMATSNIIGIAMQGSSSYLDIGDGAAVSVITTGTGGGLSFSGPFTLNVDGDSSFTAVGEDFRGINGAGLFSITGAGSVSATGYNAGIVAGTLRIEDCQVTAACGAGTAGGSGPVIASGNIMMNDAASLAITNGSASARTNTFQCADTDSTASWKLSGAAVLASGDLDGASITVTLASGATGTVEREILPPSNAVIDIGTLTGSSTITNPDGIDAWTYIPGNGVLSLQKANGNYTLTGTNHNLALDVTAGNVNITLDNVTLTRSANQGSNRALNATGNVSLTLIGDNTLSGGGSPAIETAIGVTLAIRGAGELTVTTSASCIQLGSGSTIDIGDGASVTAAATGGTSGNGLYNGSGTVTLNVDAGASFTATSAASQAIEARSLIITGAGSVSATGYYIGIRASSSLRIEDCHVTAACGEGGPGNPGVPVYSGGSNSSPVLMNDAAKLSMTNGSSSPYSVTCQRIDAASTAVWKLTGGVTLTSGALDGASIGITIASGATGTISRGGSGADKPGDVNGDGKVDATDLSMLISDFGKTSGYNPGSDINGDKKVDATDLSILISNFGK